MTGQPIRRRAAEFISGYLCFNPDASRREVIAWVRSQTHYSEQLISRAGRKIGAW